MKQRAWLLYLMAAEAALLAYLFVPGFRQGWFFNLIAVSSPIAIVCAVRMWKPERKAPWYLFALGQTFFVAGDVITYNYDKFFGSELPFPSIGDVAVPVGVSVPHRRHPAPGPPAQSRAATVKASSTR